MTSFSKQKSLQCSLSPGDLLPRSPVPPRRDPGRHRGSRPGAGAGAGPGVERRRRQREGHGQRGAGRGDQRAPYLLCREAGQEQQHRTSGPGGQEAHSRHEPPPQAASHKRGLKRRGAGCSAVCSSAVPFPGSQLHSRACVLTLLPWAVLGTPTLGRLPRTQCSRRKPAYEPHREHLRRPLKPALCTEMIC